MRLRPTQFVFLLLLLCSVQFSEDCTRQLTAEVPALLSVISPRPQRVRRLAARPAAALHPRVTGSESQAVVTLGRGLPAMTPPASAAAAIQLHTSLIRA